MNNLIKKISLIALVILFFSDCGNTSKQIVTNKTDTHDADSERQTSWYLYSTGLYYKSIEDYSKALKYFMDAAVFNEELDRIYFQISECYYFLNNNDMAINYGEMAIKADKYNSKPYFLLNRIYLDSNKNNKAADILESLIIVHPEMVNAHYSLGIIYYNRLRNNDKAMVSFRNILELSNVMPVDEFFRENADYFIARIYYSIDLLDRSIEYLQKTLEINPDNRGALYLLSNILTELYRLDEGREYSQQYIKKFETNIIIYANLGRIYYIENNPKAKGALRTAMSSDDIYGILCKALYFELMHRDKEALKLLRTITTDKSVLITPHIALGRIALRNGDKKTASSEFFTAGVILYKAGQYSAARSYLAQVVDINDNIPEVFFYLGKIYEETQYFNLAIVYFKKASKLKPDPELQIHIGYLFSQINDFKNAAKYIDTVIQQEPLNPKPYFFKGLAFSRKNDFEEAEKMIKKAIELKKDDDTYYFYLATVQEKQNKIDDTISSLKKAIEFNPKNAMVYNYLGYLYAERNMNIDESIELIQKALDLSPLNGAYLDSLGWAYFKKGDIKLALIKLLQAEKRLDKEKTPDPIVYDHIGDAYQKMGDSEKAVEYWKKSVGLQKNTKIEEKIKNPALKNSEN